MQELISPAQSKTRVLALSVFAAIVGYRVLERRGFPAGFQLPFQLSIRYTAHPIDNITRTGDFMTQIFKNVQVLWCALALSASVHGAAQAQSAVAATPTPTATPAPSATPSSSFGGGRKLTLVTETGSFKSEYKSFSEALQAAQGNSYNQTLKKGSEIIVMNARCADGIFGDKVTFSMYSLSNELKPLVKSFLDYVPSVPKPSEDLAQRARALRLERSARVRALTDEIMRLVSIASPRKADCDAVPVALALSTTEALKLEVDDAQSPLVGPKMNDGFLYDNLIKKIGAQGQKREFWEKYGYNRFATAQDALNVAAVFAGTKVLIYNGTNFSLYRINDLNYDFNASDAKLVEAKLVEAFKTTPIRKGWKIVALVRGSEFIQIYNPNVKQ